MGQQLLGKQCSNGNELAADHDVPSKDPPKSNKPCVDTSVLEGSLDQTATTDPPAIEPILVSTPSANKTTRVINDTIQTTADTSIENSSINARILRILMMEIQTQKLGMTRSWESRS